MLGLKLNHVSKRGHWRRGGVPINYSLLHQMDASVELSWVQSKQTSKSRNTFHNHVFQLKWDTTTINNISRVCEWNVWQAQLSIRYEDNFVTITTQWVFIWRGDNQIFCAPCALIICKTTIHGICHEKSFQMGIFRRTLRFKLYNTGKC